MPKSQIPRDKHSVTPVYLGATAGMRLLEKENPNATEAVLESVRNMISTYPFIFSDPKVQARILNGSEEGSFGWITSNYITGSFHVHPPSDDILPELYVRSVGALDLGGASTQITFVPKEAKSVPDNFRFNMNLYGSSYSLYTHSYLCYGINEAADRLLAIIVESRERNRTNATDLINPCAPTGHVMNITHKKLFASICANSTEAMLTFGRYIDPILNVAEDTVYIFYGGSNATACTDLVKTRMFNFNEPCPQGDGNCSFNGIYQPPVFGDFYAFSSYYYLMEFLNLSTPAVDAVAYNNFSLAFQQLCADDWDKVKTMKTFVPENLPLYCFQSVYIDTILVNGYHFDPSTTWKAIHFVSSISGVDIGWSLGFIIYESNKFTATTAPQDLTVVTFTLLAVLFSAFVLTGFFFIHWARKHRRASRRSYSFQGNTYGAI